MLDHEESNAVQRVLDSGWLTQGPEVAAFEAEFAAFLSWPGHVAAVSSGTSALLLALVAAGVTAGDEVILPSFTFAATANAVRLAGATPVFVDVTADSRCIDVQAVGDAITPRTAAVIAVHLYGHMADMPALTELAAARSLLLVEDAAQAHGAALCGRPAGTWGQVAAFSFYATKNMTCGEGGAVLTRDPAIDRRVRMLCNQGMIEYRNEAVGFNMRMTDIAASIGRAQLRKLPGFNAIRLRNAQLYSTHLQGVAVPVVSEGHVHAYHQYTITSDDRGGIAARLRAAHIETGVFYRTPVHLLPAYAEDDASRVMEMQVTQRLCDQVLSLPVGPHVTVSDATRICDVLTRG